MPPGFQKKFFYNFWYLFSVSFYYNKHIILRMRKNKAYLFNSVVNSHSGFQINLLSGKPRITSRSEPLCLLTKQLWGGDRAQIWCLFIAPCRLRAWTCWATWPQGFTNSKRDTTTCLPYVTHTYQHSKAGGMKKVCASSQTESQTGPSWFSLLWMGTVMTGWSVARLNNIMSAEHAAHRGC